MATDTLTYLHATGRRTFAGEPRPVAPSYRELAARCEAQAEALRELTGQCLRLFGALAGYIGGTRAAEIQAGEVRE